MMAQSERLKQQRASYEETFQRDAPSQAELPAATTQQRICLLGSLRAGYIQRLGSRQGKR